MFQKQTFGSTSSGFGSLNTSTTSPFGGFKLNTGTSAFGAPPAFGANATTQPATGGGLFGTPSTSGGLFGSNPSTSTFGQSSGFGFGANTSSGGLFNTSSGGGLFGNNQNNSAFGAKPATGFGFGSTANTATTGGLFGSAPSTSTGLFGQQNNTISSGGLFGGTTGGFGQTQPTGTAHVKYNPVVGTDVVVKSGTSQNVNIKHHCITCMKEYEGKCLEELRLEDYLAGRKGQASGGMFGFQQPAENKPLFGGSTFGQPATTSAPSLFGGSIGSTPAFGQTNTFSFGNNAQSNTNTTGLFGASKPAFGTTSTTGTGLFGATTTQAPTFGSTNTFGFGANTQNQSGIFHFGETSAPRDAPSSPSGQRKSAIPKSTQAYSIDKWHEFSKNFSKSLANIATNVTKSDIDYNRVRDKLILDAAAAKAAIDAKLSMDLVILDIKFKSFTKSRKKNVSVEKWHNSKTVFKENSMHF